MTTLFIKYFLEFFNNSMEILFCWNSLYHH